MKQKIQLRLLKYNLRSWLTGALAPLLRPANVEAMVASAGESTRSGTQPGQSGSGTVSNEGSSATRCYVCEDHLSPARTAFLDKMQIPRNKWNCLLCYDSAATRASPPAASEASSSNAHAPSDPQKQEIGEESHSAVAKFLPELAGNITGMLLELDNRELLSLLESEAKLKVQIDDAIQVLQSMEPPGSDEVSPSVPGSSTTPPAAVGSPGATSNNPRSTRSGRARSVPPMPPGPGWQHFDDDGFEWWYYDGDLGKWWVQPGGKPQRYPEDEDHVASAAHQRYCILVPHGKFGDRICHINEDGTHTIGTLAVGNDLEPDRIHWRDGDIWVRRSGFPSKYLVGERWSGRAKDLPTCQPNTEWVLQPSPSCYDQFGLYKLSPINAKLK